MKISCWILVVAVVALSLCGCTDTQKVITAGKMDKKAVARGADEYSKELAVVWANPLSSDYMKLFDFSKLDYSLEPNEPNEEAIPFGVSRLDSSYIMGYFNGKNGEFTYMFTVWTRTSFDYGVHPKGSLIRMQVRRVPPPSGENEYEVSTCFYNNDMLPVAIHSNMPLKLVELWRRVTEKLHRQLPH